MIMFAIRTKGRVHSNNSYSYSFQQATEVSCYKYTVEEKQKYHITFLWEEKKRIELHHILPNSSENVFHVAFVILKLQE